MIAPLNISPRMFQAMRLARHGKDIRGRCLSRTIHACLDRRLLDWKGEVISITHKGAAILDIVDGKKPLTEIAADTLDKPKRRKKR